MNLQDFISKWNGKIVDFDGVYPDQCMDLMHQYALDVLGITDKSVLAAPAAYEVFTNFKWDNLFTKITNTPTGIPQSGDILFFGTTIGQYGHVCVFVDGNATNFTSFDANWPLGSLPHLQPHNYNGVLGWLRFKTTPIPSPTLPSTPMPPPIPSDEIMALEVLKKYIQTSTDQNGQPFGNLEGYANTLAQDAYKAWKTPPTANQPINDSLWETLKKLLGR